MAMGESWKLLCVAWGRAEVSCSQAVWCLEAVGGEGSKEGWWSNQNKFAKILSRVWLLRLRLSGLVLRSTIPSLWICLSWNQERDFVVLTSQKPVNILYLLGFSFPFHLLSLLSFSWSFVKPQRITTPIRMNLGLQAKWGYHVVPQMVPCWCFQL